jgi:hypothetical protein
MGQAGRLYRSRLSASIRSPRRHAARLGDLPGNLSLSPVPSRPVPFRSICRECVGWALAQAWGEASQAAAVAAIPTEAKAARVEEVHQRRSAMTS